MALKVVLLLEDLLFGGTQRQALETARRLDPAEVDARLWVLLDGRDFAPLVEQAGLDALWLTRSKSLGPRGLYALWRALRRERPDVLVLLTALPNIWGRLLGRLCGVPVIIANIRQSGAPKRYHERWLKGFAHHHICNAHALGALLQKEYSLPASRISVIPNGVDVERFRPGGEQKGEDVVFMSAGRLVHDKDQKTLIAAFARVAVENPHARLELYGDGPLRGELESQVSALPGGIGQRISINQGRSDLENVYPQADVFVLSSLREGMPNVVLEAMASGLPVVACNVDGVPELVEHEHTGILVPSGDDVALAAGMSTLLQHADMRRRMGEAGRERAVTAFSFESTARAHERLFKLLSGGENS